MQDQPQTTVRMPRSNLIPLEIEWQQREELFAWEQAVIFKVLATPVAKRARAQGIIESALHD
jgi:hypothetical protein